MLSLFRSTRILAVVLSGIVPLLTDIAHARSAEDIFTDAGRFTVKIRTNIEIPFIEDEEGAAKATGFLVDKKHGWIVTNAHVTGHSPANIEVAFKTSNYINAEKVYVDSYLDVAFLKIEKKNIPDNVIEAPMDCNNIPISGHPVGAYGHPWEVYFTATRGIISGRTWLNGKEWLQTDAPVNHGNSGGPLISMQSGRVVGINTAAADKKETEGLNFAIPIKYVCRIVELMREDRDPSPPYLPLAFLSSLEGESIPKVAAIYSKEENFPLKVNDTIMKVGDTREPISNTSELMHLLRGQFQNTIMIVNRNGKDTKITANLSPMANYSDRRGIFFSGLLIAENTLMDYHDFNLNSSLMVHSVESGSLANSHHFSSWDFVISINGKSNLSLNALYELLKQTQSENTDAVFVVKRLTNSDTKLFEFFELRLPVKDIKYIPDL